MVETREFSLEVDVLDDASRLEAVREGIKKALTKGRYEQGVDFEIRSLNLKAR